MAASDGKQIGHGEFENPFQQHALMWSGSAASYVNLHPAGFWHSAGRGIGGSQQVGYGIRDQFFGNRTALLWHGTAESVVDLHPASAPGDSEANDTDGVQQVGAVGMGGPFHAALWTGTAESFVDLNPPGATSSWAYSVANGQQAGYIGTGGTLHAALWRSSPGSVVDLNPGPDWGSIAYATNGAQQVGAAATAGFGRRAAVWSGTPESYLDLHQFLPPEYFGEFNYSEAKGIDEFGNIVGWAVENMPDGFRSRAVLWVVPEPGTVLALSAGLLALALQRRSTKG